MKQVLFDRLKSNLAQCINDGTIYFVNDSNGNFTQIALGDGSKSHVVGIGPKMDDATKQELMSKLGLTISADMGTIQLGKLANHNGISSQKVVTYERTGLGTDVHEISTVGYVQQYLKTAKAMVYSGVFNAQTKEITDYNNAIISPSEEGNVTFDYLLEGYEGESLLTPGMSFIVGTAGDLQGYTGISIYGGETKVEVGDMIIITDVTQKESEEGGSTYNEASILIIQNTNSKISDGPITTAKLADGAVTNEKLSTDIQSLIRNLSKTATFAGIATPTTNPGSPEGPVFYIANGKGTYTNFGGIDITEDEVIILYYDTAWHKESTGIASNDKLTELESLEQNLLPKINISSTQLVQGSLYNGFLDASSTNCLSTSIFYRVTPGSTISYFGKHNDESPTCRYTFYTKDKVYLSNVGYISLQVIVPSEAYFCKLSFSFSSDISPTDIADYELLASVCYDWTFLEGNNGAAIGAALGTGKINFDNTNKKVIISDGFIDVIRNYKRIEITNKTLDYGTQINQSKNFAVYLVLTKDNNLAWLNPNFIEDFEIFKDSIILASISITTDDVIEYNNVNFCATKFQINGVDSSLLIAGLPAMYTIHSYQLKQGSNYSGSIDGDAKFVATPDMYPIKNTEKLFVKVSKANYVNYRVVFYDANFSVIQNTPYTTATFTPVPTNAFYFSISVQFSENTAPNDIVDGDITVSQYIDDEWGINSGAKLALPLLKGYLNFDNTNKIVRVTGDNLMFGFDNELIEIPENTEVSFSDLSMARGSYYYFVLDENNNLVFKIFNGNTTTWNELHRCKIIATIILTQEKTIREENITFITVPYKIDDGVLMDYTIIKDYCALFNTQNPIDSFLFFTDPHLLNTGFDVFDKNKYIQALKNYYEATPTSLCICGGDWMNHFDNEDVAAQCLGYVNGYMSKNFKNYIPIVGNHDYNKYQEGHIKLNTQTLVNLWYQDIGKTYYFTENRVNNSRFYYFDSGIDNEVVFMDDYKWEQINWFATKLQDNIEHNIIFIHISLAYATVYSEISKNLTLIAQAYNAKTTITLNEITYDFTKCTGSVHCLISGHTHMDTNDILNSIPVVTTTDLTYSGEPSFDLCAIDYVTKKLNLVRVGAGSSRIIDIL